MATAPIPLLENGSPGSGPTLVLAHGAGAPMDSPFMTWIASALAAEGLYVLRFEFPYMRQSRQTGRRGRPDSQEALQMCWAEVIEQLGGGRDLVIGGKSMGGRIASMVADRLGVRGLACLGYPFHPPGRPGSLRTAHLQQLKTPSLIVQGSRDPLGSQQEVEGFPLSASIRVLFLEDGDHSFKPRRSSGFSLEDHLGRAVKAVAEFCRHL